MLHRVIHILCAGAILFVHGFVMAQKEPQKEILVRFISEIPEIDGLLDEEIWEEADVGNDFFQNFPTDTLQGRFQTEVRFLTDGETLYVGLKQYIPAQNFLVPTLRRDYRAGQGDNISLVFDTFNDGTNAFLFGITPLGVRREALITNGGDDGGFTTTWDVKWLGESQVFEEYYTSEMAIPLSSFRFRDGETQWRFNSFRFDFQSTEVTSWVRIPQNQSIINLAFMGTMVFETPLKKARSPIALIPYAAGFNASDFEGDVRDTEWKFGGDAKLIFGNSLNLDITVNPDFSQVEVDNFITNLTRFEVGLPERRQFFIDNNDLFGSFGGNRDANPFFSRRIGIAKDTAGETIENPIILGARLSGKLNTNLRIGALNIQTEEDADNGIPGQNHSMISLQQKVFGRSNISAFFLNRQSTSEPPEKSEISAFNRVAGLDYNLASADGVFNGKAYGHKSWQPGDSDGNLSLGSFLAFNTRKYGGFVDWVYIDQDFQSDLGFVRRTDINKWAINASRRFWPDSDKAINNHGFELFNVQTFQPSRDMRLTDRTYRISYRLEWNSLEQLEVGWNKDFTLLFDEFDPSGTDGAIPLPAETSYDYSVAYVQFQSDDRKRFTWRTEITAGSFFNGQRYSFEGRADLRIQPKANISIQANIDRLDMPAPYSSATIILLSPRFDLTFSKSVFWSTLVQYSNQRNDVGINSRLQWRFAPLSDLFLVYNDNYLITPWAPRNRSINLKLTYWLNL